MSADLIQQLEQATEGSRELDAAIAEELGHQITWLPPGDIRNANGGPVIRWQKPHPYAGMREPCPSFTTSLDAALTLVPDGWSWTVRVSENRLHSVVTLGRSYPTNATVPQEGHTPALAVVIAALKARGVG